MKSITKYAVATSKRIPQNRRIGVLSGTVAKNDGKNLANMLSFAEFLRRRDETAVNPPMTAQASASGTEAIFTASVVGDAPSSTPFGMKSAVLANQMMQSANSAVKKTSRGEDLKYPSVASKKKI